MAIKINISDKFNETVPKLGDFMSKFFLSVSTSDDVDDYYADEQVDDIEISKGQSISFELTDEEAMSLYHFIRQCLLLENKITITVADSEGFLVHRDNKN